MEFVSYHSRSNAKKEGQISPHTLASSVGTESLAEQAHLALYSFPPTAMLTERPLHTSLPVSLDFLNHLKMTFL